jgi:O-antigen/teichoic acid export membrane protein
LAGSFGALTINVPRYFLESAEGVEALGIFAANAYLLTVGTLVINALGQSASPRLASLYSMGDLVTFRNLLLKLLGLGTFLGLTGVAIVLIAGDSLLTLLYGSQYAMHADVLLILMMAATIQFMYVFLGTALKAARKFMMDAYSQAISLALVFVMSALLIPRFGMYAAALVILIKAVLEAGIYVSRVMVTLNVRRLDNA